MQWGRREGGETNLHSLICKKKQNKTLKITLDSKEQVGQTKIGPSPHTHTHTTEGNPEKAGHHHHQEATAAVSLQHLPKQTKVQKLGRKNKSPQKRIKTKQQTRETIYQTTEINTHTQTTKTHQRE